MRLGRLRQRRVSLNKRLAAEISAATGIPFDLAHAQAASGGCIHHGHILTGRCGRKFFVKSNRADRLDLFTAEAEGLCELTNAHCLHIPQPIAWAADQDNAWLILEYLPLASHGDAAALGQTLAALHRHTEPRFGWRRDNHIGNTPQPNAWHDDWICFWREQRLGFQLDLARHNSAPDSLIKACRAVASHLPELFADYRPVASLLHGDLWGGNAAFVNAAPCLFDPAVYYGDREADIAMTELFGGFGPAFYAAYQAAWPLNPGYARRRDLYNLYHLLNHFNLFGGSYGQQAEHSARRLCAPA